MCGDVTAPRMYQVGDKLDKMSTDFFCRASSISMNIFIRNFKTFILTEYGCQIQKVSFAVCFENPSTIKRKMPKGPLTTQLIDGMVADQLSKMSATIIGFIPFGLHEHTKLMFFNIRYNHKIGISILN